MVCCDLYTGKYSILLVNLLLIIIAAAVYVSCQELTSTLRDRSHACRGKEVIFTCTIRGSQTLTNLILAWSSTEYIGQGNRLRFTTREIPGVNRTSLINENVTATLTSNTSIDGVPTLVSDLRIIADQASTMTCRSETANSNPMRSKVFNISGTYMYNVTTVIYFRVLVYNYTVL